MWIEGSRGLMLTRLRARSRFQIGLDGTTTEIVHARFALGRIGRE